MIYLLLLVYLIYCCYKYDYLNRQAGKNRHYRVCLALLILISGLRYRIGVDTIRYESHFQELQELDRISPLLTIDGNPLFWLVASFVKTIGGNYVIFQLLHALFVNTVVCWFIKSNTKNVFTGIIFYYIALYLNFNCEVMKESSAVCMFLIGLSFYKKKEWLKYLACIIISCLFHPSALVLIPLFIIQYLRISKLLRVNLISLMVFVSIIIFAAIFQDMIFSYMLLLNIGEHIGDKIEAYSLGDLSGQTFTSITGIASQLCSYFILPFLSVYLLKKCKKTELWYEDLVFVCCLVAMLMIPVTLIYRYNNYFAIFGILAMAELSFRRLDLFLVKYIDFKRWLVVLSMFIFVKVYVGLFIPTDYGIEASRYFPYSSVMEKTKNNDREKLLIYYHAY